MLQKTHSSYTITAASETYDLAIQDKGTAHPVTENTILLSLISL
jgi:hypothetical protein